MRYKCEFYPIEQIPEVAQVTWADVERWEARLREIRKGGLVGQRIWPGLYRLDNLRCVDYMTIREVRASDGPFQGTPFRVSSWDEDPEKKIEVGMIYDLEEKQMKGLWPHASHYPLPGDEPPPAEPGPYVCSHMRHRDGT